jgi:hypothetical protein
MHGAIHFMGFAKAFDLGQMTALTKAISKPMGLLWMLAGLLFILSGILYFSKKEIWPILAIMAVVLSQILILTVWKDAKLGTVFNALVLVIGIVAQGTFQFNKMVKQETLELVAHPTVIDHRAITGNDIKHLPNCVQRWMKYSGVLGKERIVSVWLKQKGEMKTKPEAKWMPFTADQYYNVRNPAFVWSTEVDFMPMIKLMGRDIFTNGKGEMLIKLAALLPVAKEGNNVKINTGAMLRFMAEMTWFPSAALNDYISWETVDENSAKASFTIDGETVSGRFTFSDTGEMLSFEAQRYYGGGPGATLETWLIRTSGHTDFNGYKIPSQCSVIWKLKEGDFNWLNVELADCQYNSQEIF